MIFHYGNFRFEAEIDGGCRAGMSSPAEPPQVVLQRGWRQSLRGHWVPLTDARLDRVAGTRFEEIQEAAFDTHAKAVLDAEERYQEARIGARWEKAVAR